MAAIVPDVPPTPKNDEQRYRDLFEVIPAATFVIQAGTIVFASRSAVEIMNADSAEQVVGKPVMDFISPQDRPRAAERFNQVYSGSAVDSVREYLVKRLDGTAVMVAARSVPIDYGGQPASLTVCIDISERHAAELALRKSEARYRDLIEHLPLATWVADDGIVRFANPAALRLVGATGPGEIVGKPFLDFIRADGRSRMAEQLGRIAVGEEPSGPMDCGLLRLNGSEAEIQAHMLPITFADRAATLAVTVDITEKKASEAEAARANARLRKRFSEVQEQQQQMYEQAIKDGLTGLYNRRYFDEAFERQLSLARRNDADLSVLMLDIDHFKAVNDTFGHQAGDEVLRCLATLLSQTTRSGDIPCRYGGEEFVVVMPAAPSAGAFKRAEELRNAFAALDVDLGEGRRWRGTLSAGVASYPRDRSEAGGLVACADEALYAAKRAGRNCTRSFADIAAKGEDT